MPMNIIRARETTDNYQFTVHLDSAKLDAKGQPHPSFVRTYTWGKEPPPGQNRAQYLAAIRRETKLLAQDALARIQDEGTPLPDEGKPL